MRWIRRSSPIALLAAGLLACTQRLAAPLPSAHPDDATPRRGGTIRIAAFADPRSFDPATASDGLSAQVDELLYAGLLDYDANMRLVPDLAERWEVADAGKTYRFFLREGARFHDGEEVTAEDVKRSAERALHPTTPNPFASVYENLKGYADYTENRAAHLAGVVVEGRYVVAFRLAKPDATFLSTLVLPVLRPVCRSAGGRYADTWQPCGAGPFSLAAFQRGTSARLVRHEGYFRPGEPYLDAVEWMFSMPVGTQRLKFEVGDLDILREQSTADLVRFQNDPRWRPFGEIEAETAVYGEGMNVEMPPFDNVEVRRAVAAAIDREHYRLLRPASLSVATQLIPPGVPGYDPTVNGQRYDYAAALEHMRRAGYPFDPATGRGGYPVHVEYLISPQGLFEYQAQVLKQELAKIGIRIDIRIASWPAYLAATHRRGRVPMAPQSWTMDYPDASDFYESLFTSQAINEEDSNNTSFYANREYDALVANARRELDPEARRRLYAKAGAILCDEAPWAFTHFYHYYDVRQPYVHGYKPHPIWMEDVAHTWLDRLERPGALASILGPAR
jgi:ABC-type transport system substrate-binding protein